MKQFLVPEDLINDLVAYLVQRPFAEVARGVTRLQACREHVEPKDSGGPERPIEVVPLKQEG